MQDAIRQAVKAYEADEVPVGAVIVRNDRVIARAWNQVEMLNDATAHAEMLALTAAEAAVGDWRLNDCTLYVTKEPCPMCAGALVQARVGQVIFAATDPKRGAMGSTINLATHMSAHHRMTVIGGVQGEEAKEMLSSWFKQRRRRAAGTGAAPFQTDSTTC